MPGYNRCMAVDPVRLEVFQHLLAAVCEESGALLRRTAISPNIRERLDFSCALFDRDARLVAQAAHIPVHLGSMPASVEYALREFETFKPTRNYGDFDGPSVPSKLVFTFAIDVRPTNLFTTSPSTNTSVTGIALMSNSLPDMLIS